MKKQVIALHILVILLAYSSPFWLNWKLIATGIVLYYLQILIFGWCILSLAQFGGEKQSFHEWYLRKLGLSVNRRKLNFFLTWEAPFILLVLALFLQVVLNLEPLVNI